MKRGGFLDVCWVAVFPLLVVLLVTLALGLSGHETAAFVVGNGGTIGVLMANLSLIATGRTPPRLSDFLAARARQPHPAEDARRVPGRDEGV